MARRRRGGNSAVAERPAETESVAAPVEEEVPQEVTEELPEPESAEVAETEVEAPVEPAIEAPPEKPEVEAKPPELTQIERLRIELANAQKRYDKQHAMEPKPSGWAHTIAWRDLTLRKIAAIERGETVSKGARIPEIPKEPAAQEAQETAATK